MILIAYLYIMSFFPPLPVWFVVSFVVAGVLTFVYQVSKLFAGE